MDLELADYQRTVQSLESDISSRDAQLLTASQITTLLKLSPKEKEYVMEITKGEAMAYTHV